MGEYEEQTQKYSSFGDKLLQHGDVMAEIQKNGLWKPINIQLSLTAVCDSRCTFCSVDNRDRSFKLKFDDIKKCLRDFKLLGAKALEITGGGNPLLYPQINEVIDFAYNIGYTIGIISNHHNPEVILKPETIEQLTWYRASLTKLEEGKTANDFNFDAIPGDKLSFSHILNDRTTEETFKEMAKLVQRYPEIKFVRIAGDCLNTKSIEEAKEKWKKIIDKYNKNNKFFMKEIEGNHHPYEKFCGVGAIRPYIAEDGFIYICTSHVLKNRKLDDEFRLGHISEVKEIFEEMKHRFKETGKPYPINISEKCTKCFYYNNNKLLHTISKGYKKFRDRDADFA